MLMAEAKEKSTPALMLMLELMLKLMLELMLMLMLELMLKLMLELMLMSRRPPQTTKN